MNKAIRYLVSAIAIATLLLGSLAMAPAAKAQPAPLRMQSGTFIPVQNNLLAANGGRYFIIQFAGPVEQEWKDSVTAQGVELLDYVPDFAFKARMNLATAKNVAKQSFVSAVVPFEGRFKLKRGLMRDGEMRVYAVRLERGSDFAGGHNLLARTGAQVLGVNGDTVFILANSALIDAIANVDDVASISNFYLNQTFSTSSKPGTNDTSRDIIGATIANTRGYDGSTQTVAVADTGIGGGTVSTVHRDIPSSRVTAVYNWPGAAGSCFKTVVNDGAIDVDSGHGTHTSGSVLSGGEPSGLGRGTAPSAHLIFQATENYATITNLCKTLYGYTDGYYLLGLPTDLKTLYQQAYNAGARIHSNSWGAALAGDYNTDGVNTDSFVWTNRDMVITFSAGNEGIDANSDGVIDNDSIGSPGTSKNVITVGASENQRTDNYPCDTSLAYTTCASQSGANVIATYGTSWPSDYPANPIFSDPGAGNSNQMAAFSSRGPTDDGRIKPDVVAPGTWILSTYSDLYQQGYDASANPQNGAYQYDGWGFPYNSYYKYMGGTSMSNPLTAGGAAVIKDYYSKAYSFNATAALVKATLINSAVDILDENNDGVNDNDFPIPNNHEGWGRINLDAATDGTIQFVDEGTGLATNGTQTFTVTSTGGPLKVTVVWSDYPSTDTATVNLVNDLDLTVAGPSGTFLGNVFSGGWSTTGGSADRRNNVENVYVQSPAAGTYTITVKGFNVPNGPQKFALTVDGGTFGTDPTPTPTNTTIPPTPTNTGVPPTATNTGIPPTPTNTPAPSTNTGFLTASANTAITTSAGDNNGYQTNPTNAYANDSVFAVDTNSGNGTSTSCTSTAKDRHNFYNYGVSLPGTAVVQGITVRLDARVDATNGSPKICVQLSWDGGTTWTTAKNTTTLTTSEATYTLGSSSDTWGRTWTASNLSNTNFRVRVIDVASNTSRDFSLDYVSVNVTYLP
ncbi:MAG: S8 family serine peptidase [Anaerolineales bacterium]|nr:S8 family serine peptidase [Anaerolineales bacterium]